MNYNDWKRAKRIKAAEARISRILDKAADSFLHKDAAKIDSVYNRGLGQGLSKKIPNAPLAKGDKEGGVYEYIARNGTREGRPTNKIERVITKQLARDRETLQDYISKSTNQSLVATLVHLAKLEAKLGQAKP